MFCLLCEAATVVAYTSAVADVQLWHLILKVSPITALQPSDQTFPACMSVKEGLMDLDICCSLMTERCIDNKVMYC